MTSERLQEILDEISDNGTRIMRPHMVMKAMKQAVNEALEEAAENAATKESPRKVSNKHFVYDTVVDKQSILNLKVK